MYKTVIDELKSIQTNVVDKKMTTVKPLVPSS